jgi:hypothetical protein
MGAEGTQNTIIHIFTAMRTSNLVQHYILAYAVEDINNM